MTKTTKETQDFYQVLHDSMLFDAVERKKRERRELWDTIWGLAVQIVIILFAIWAFAHIFILDTPYG